MSFKTLSKLSLFFIIFLTLNLLADVVKNSDNDNNSGIVDNISSPLTNNNTTNVFDTNTSKDVILIDSDEDTSGGGVVVDLISESFNGVSFLVKFPEPVIEDKDINGDLYQIVKLPTNGEIYSEGKPQLPQHNIHIAVPDGCKIRLRFSTGDEIIYENVRPAPTPSYDNELKPSGEVFPIVTYLPDEEIYNSGDLFPLIEAEIISRGEIRGLEIIEIGINPIIFNTSDNEVKFHDEIKVELDFLNTGLTELRQYQPQGKGDEEFWNQLVGFVLNSKTADYFKSDDVPQGSYDIGITPFDLYDGDPTFKIFIKDEGIYKISYNWLTNHCLNLDGIDPRTIKIYTGNHIDLPVPEEMTIPVPNTIEEVPLYIVGEADGVFDSDDYIIFYGFGTDFYNEEGDHFKSDYTDYAVYWLTYDEEGVENGLRLQETSLNPEDGTPLADYYRHYTHREEDWAYLMLEDNNYSIPLETDHWMWKKLQAHPETPMYEPFSFSVYDIKPDTQLNLGFLIQGYSTDNPDDQYHHTKLFLNYRENDDYLIYENDDWEGFEYINPSIFITSDFFTRDDNTLYFSEYADIGNTTLSTVYPDFFEFNYLRQYRPLDNSLIFRSPEDIGGLVRYSVGPYNDQEILLIDIKNQEIISGETVDKGDGYYKEFQKEVSTEGDIFIAAGSGFLKTPVDMIIDQQSNLHTDTAGADALYIVYDDYYDEIQPLINLRKSQGYIIKCVKIEDIYDEYSRGLFDPTAIKYYIWDAYYNWSTPSLAYVCLVGDCYYIYKDNVGQISDDLMYKKHTLNTVPTYMFRLEDNPLAPSDNWFVCVDVNEDESFNKPDTYADLVITRIPAWDSQQVTNYVEKVMKYELQPIYGDWKIRSVFAADNRTSSEGGSFPYYCENVISDHLPYGFYPERIYIDDMDFEDEDHDDTTGKKEYRFRVVRPVLTPLLKENFYGLITQYQGHGSMRKWAAEGLFWDHVIHPDSPFYPDMLGIIKYGELYDDAYTLPNINKTPVVLQLSCSLGRYDYQVHCMSEKLITMADNGAIFSTGESRLGPTSQYVTHQNFYDELFSGGVVGNVKPNIALSFHFAKYWSQPERIKQTMFGDALLKLGVPTKKVILDPFSSPPYQRGTTINISGYIDGDADFNGYAKINIYDEVYYCRVYVGGGDRWNVYRKRLLGTTVVDVLGGDFSGDLFIPEETGNDTGDTEVYVQVYAWDETRDFEAMLNPSPAEGEVTFTVSGLTDTGDETGPDITILAGNENFINGDAVPVNCPLWIDLWDESGIRTANDEVSDPIQEGRVYDEPITLQITNHDKNTTEEMDLTGYYEPSLNDYRSGQIFCVLNLETGSSTIEVSAQDNFNNISTTSIDVLVAESTMLTDVLNCPNPVTDGETYFTFVSGTPLDLAKVQIFTVSGRRIREIEEYSLSAGYNQIHWDGRDSNGKRLANGVYLYKIIAKYNSETAEEFEKLVIMR